MQPVLSILLCMFPKNEFVILLLLIKSCNRLYRHNKHRHNKHTLIFITYDNFTNHLCIYFSGRHVKFKGIMCMPVAFYKYENVVTTLSVFSMMCTQYRVLL